jgi:hypothetical protein
MATGPNQQRLTPDERANLVAYIDGELGEDESRAISTKLTRSPTARHEIETLRKTWEMLDLLPRPAASSDFSGRTISLVRQIEETPSAWGETLEAWSRSSLRAGALVVLACVVFGIGFGVTRWLIPDRTGRLSRDLSIAEHLDEYLDVDSFEFLSRLYDSAEFGPAAKSP